jgi:hypothetical protein
MKKCNKCNEKKDYDKFRKDRRTLDGYYNICIKCDNAYKADYKKRKKEGTIIAF